jgi:hypothetical protein
MGVIRNVHRIVAGETEWKGLLGAPIHRWKDNIEICF